MNPQAGHSVLLAGTGAYLPGEPIPFDQIEQVLGAFDDVPPDFQRWLKRTRSLMKQLLGMEYYYYAIDPQTGEKTETPSTLAAKAGARALEAAGVTPEEVELLIYAGAASDRWVCPPTSVFVQQHLGIPGCAEMSIHSNCTSTYKALRIATDAIAYGRHKTVLVVSANQVSNLFHARTMNQQKLTRQQALMRWFLCDGAGALVLKRDDGQQAGLRVYHTFLESVGIHAPPQMFTQVGATTHMAEAYAQGLHHLTQDFQQVSQIGPRFFIDGMRRFAAELGLDPDDRTHFDHIAYFLANVPADHLVELGMEEARAQWGMGLERLKAVLYSTVARRGYTGPAAMPITLDKLVREAPLQDGQFIVSFVTESSKWMNAGFVMRYQQP
ncbi:MAG: 3-oxoacyl-ACP synthase III family protein [Myxococcota bacterium]